MKTKPAFSSCVLRSLVLSGLFCGAAPAEVFIAFHGTVDHDSTETYAPDQAVTVTFWINSGFTLPANTSNTSEFFAYRTTLTTEPLIWETVTGTLLDGAWDLPDAAEVSPSDGVAVWYTAFNRSLNAFSIGEFGEDIGLSLGGNPVNQLNFRISFNEIELPPQDPLGEPAAYFGAHAGFYAATHSGTGFIGTTGGAVDLTVTSVEIGVGDPSVLIPEPRLLGFLVGLLGLLTVLRKPALSRRPARQSKIASGR